jgi:hypothetical protein
VLFSARAFYFVMFALFYIAASYYPNKLKTAIMEDQGGPPSYFYVLIFFSVHVASVVLFLNAGSNPGFVDETETPNSKREKAKLFVGQYDEFKGVDDKVNIVSSNKGGSTHDRSYEVLDNSNTQGEDGFTGEGTLPNGDIES